MSVRRLSADISMLQSVVESDDRIYRIQVRVNQTNL